MNNPLMWNSPNNQGNQGVQLNNNSTVGQWGNSGANPYIPPVIEPIQPIQPAQFGPLAYYKGGGSTGSNPLPIDTGSTGTTPDLATGYPTSKSIGNIGLSIGNVGGKLTPDSVGFAKTVPEPVPGETGPSLWESVTEFFKTKTPDPTFAQLQQISPMHQAYMKNNPDTPMTIEEYYAKMQEGTGGELGFGDIYQGALSLGQAALGWSGINRQLKVAEGQLSLKKSMYADQRGDQLASQQLRRDRANRDNLAYEQEKANG